MQNKILVVALGGTIGSVKGDSISLDDNTLKVLDFVENKSIQFDTARPFSILSECISFEHWQMLIDYLKDVDFSAYLGVIILHGSDTLAFTSSIIANAFPNEKIVLVASNKPIEDKNSNGIKNLNNAVEKIIMGISHPMVSYDGIYDADCITSANILDEFVAIKKTVEPLNRSNINNNNILIVKQYPNNNHNNYNLDNLDAVLIEMYHSATVNQHILDFCKRLEKADIKYYFVTHQSSADYETANDLKNIIFNCTLENAYARLILE